MFAKLRAIKTCFQHDIAQLACEKIQQASCLQKARLPHQQPNLMVEIASMSQETLEHMYVQLSIHSAQHNIEHDKPEHCQRCVVLQRCPGLVADGFEA